MSVHSAMAGARIAEQDAFDRRNTVRLPVEIEGRVRPLGEEGCSARILNLSDTGFMAETTEHYEVGSRVWLIVPGRERANAIVKWTAGNRIGAEFASPVAAAILRA